MKVLSVFFIVAAVGSCVESSKQHVQYVTAPKSVRAEHAARVAAQQKNVSNAEADDASGPEASASELSPNMVAHQQHAQRVALEQQLRIAKLTFGEQNSRSAPPRATVIATSIHQPSQGVGQMQSLPVAYTVIRQRQVGAPAEVSQKYLPSPTPLRYHPVMSYMTIIQHPPPGTQPQPQATQSQILSPQYYNIPQSQPQGIHGSPYSSGKSETVRHVPQDSPVTTTAAINSGPYRFVSPAKSAASLKSSYSPSAHLGFAGNSFTNGPTSRPLYSPATIPSGSKYASPPPPPSDPESEAGADFDSYPYPPRSEYSVDTSSGTNAFLQQQSSAGPPPVIREHHHYISDLSEGQAVFRGNQASIQPSVQLPPHSLKDLLNDNVDQVYAPPRSPPTIPRGPPPPPEDEPSGPSPSHPSMFSHMYSSGPSQTYYTSPPQQPQPSSNAHSLPIQYMSVSGPASQRRPSTYLTSGPGEPQPPPKSSVGPSGAPQISNYYTQHAIPQNYISYQPSLEGAQVGDADTFGNSITDAELRSIYNTAY